MDLLYTEFMGTAAWMWLTFIGLVITLLVLDLGLLNRDRTEISVAKSLKLSAFYISLGLAFSAFVWAQMGAEAAGLYLTAFIVEKTLAMDNVFVIAMVFTTFAIPRHLQHRVLFWGILGVTPGGTPSTVHPKAGPWLSPQVVTRKRWPKLLTLISGAPLVWSGDSPALPLTQPLMRFFSRPALEWGRHRPKFQSTNRAPLTA